MKRNKGVAKKKYKITPLTEFENSNNIFFGYVNSIVRKQSKAGKDMAIVSIKDDTGETSFYVWKNQLPRVADVHKNDCMLFKLDTFKDDVKFLDSVVYHFKFKEGNWS